MMASDDETTISVVHTADCHLGYKPGNMAFNKQIERMKDVWKNFDIICKFTLDTNADIFIIAGDLFHTNLPGNQDRFKVTKALREIHDNGTSIVIVGGNHDMPRSREEGKSPIATLAAAGIAHFLESPNTIESVLLDIKGKVVRVSGLSFNNLALPTDDPVQGINIPVDGDFNIFVTHANASFHKKKREDEYKFEMTDIPESIHYVALGHIHEETMSTRPNATVANKTFFVYPGSIEHLEIVDEPKPKCFYRVLFHQDGNVELDRQPLETRLTRVVTAEIDKTTLNVHDAIVEQFPDNIPKESIVKLRLKGTLNLDVLETYKKVQLLDEYSERFFSFSIDDTSDLKKYSPQANIEDVENARPRTVLETYLEKAIADASTDGDKQLLKDVKAVILDAFNKHAEEINMGDET